MREMVENLKAERLRQGLTLEEISRRACISVSVLEALEEGDLGRIGTPLLICNFLRGYCRELGIDSVPLLEEHAREIQSCDRQMEGIQRYGYWMKHSTPRRWKGKLILLLLGLVVVGSLFGGIYLAKRHDRLLKSSELNRGAYTQQELPADLPERVSAASEGAVESSGSSSPGETVSSGGSGTAEGGSTPRRALDAVENSTAPGSGAAAGGAQPQKHRFTIQADQATRVQVTIDGKTMHKVRLKAGEQGEWEAAQGMQIVVGNPGKARMTWDGQPLQPAVKKGRSLRLRLPQQAPTPGAVTPGASVP